MGFPVQGFFDAAWCSDLLAEESIYALLAQHGDRIVHDEDFAECYSERQGRPSIPPSLLAKVLLLAYREAFSDERAMEALRFDLRWKVALDLPIDLPAFTRRAWSAIAPASCCTARSGSSSTARLSSPPSSACSRERRSRSSIRPRCSAPPRSRTPRPWSARGSEGSSTQSRTWTKGPPRSSPRGFASISPARARSPPATGRTRPRVRCCSEVARDAVRALRAVEEDEELAADAAIAEAAKLLREIVGREFEVEDDEVPRPRRGRRTRQIVSAHDPEMRHGRQTAARPLTGYKIHAAAAAEAPILTAISLSAANEHDGHHAGALVDQQSEQRRPKRVIGDTAYGNVEAREELEARSISVLAPVHSTSSKDGRIPKNGFGIDLETETLTCPPRQDGADLQAQTESKDTEAAKRGRRAGRQGLAKRLRAPPAASALLAERAAGYPNPAPRGPAPSRASGVIRSRRARPSQAHQAANRAAARADRLPLPRAQEPLPRGPKIRVPGRLDRRPRQPPPDRGRPATNAA
jgi:Transposase domain (DUF772)/Transposase DDE domain